MLINVLGLNFSNMAFNDFRHFNEGVLLLEQELVEVYLKSFIFHFLNRKILLSFSIPPISSHNPCIYIYISCSKLQWLKKYFLFINSNTFVLSFSRRYLMLIQFYQILIKLINIIKKKLNFSHLKLSKNLHLNYFFI